MLTLEEKIDQILHKAIADHVFPSVVVKLEIKDQVLYEKALGNFTYDKNSPEVTIDTVYDIASVTKIIVATGALRLIEVDEIDLQQTIKTYLPTLGDSFVGNCTVYSLLTHTSGINIALSKCSDKELVNLLSVLSGISAPGSGFDDNVVYANVNSYLLGEIITAVTKQNLSDFLTKEVLGPLNMHSTKFSDETLLKKSVPPTELDEREVVQGIVHDESARKIGRAVGHAGLFSSVQDLNNFLSMWTNEGVFEEKRFLEKKTVHQAVSNKVSGDISVGLGWHLDNSVYLGKCAPVNTFFHPGFTGSLIVGNLEQGIRLSFLSNRTYPKRLDPKLKNQVFQNLMNTISSEV